MIRALLACGLGILSTLAANDAAAASIRECRKNPEGCSSAQLCSNEILGRNGEFGYSYPEHAAYAAKLGLPCAPKSLPRIQETPLRVGFNFLSRVNRKKIQSNLALLGYYSSTVDGVYGNKTALALGLYNEKHLDGLDLSSHGNVNIVLTYILSLKPPAVSQQPVEPQPPSNFTPPAAEELERGTTPPALINVGSGTGFIVSSSGHIVSNAHVTGLCEEVRAHLTEQVLTAAIITQDTKNDLAILRVNAQPEYVFSLATSTPFPLQEIVVVGFPFGESISSSVKFTRGIVSAIAGLGNDSSQIQVDAAMQPGNSGGPILDDHGNVVAVAVSKLSLKETFEGYGVIPENINFGIKASVVRTLLEGHGVKPLTEKATVVSAREIGESATKGVVRLSCWMSPEKIRALTSAD